MSGDILPPFAELMDRCMYCELNRQGKCHSCQWINKPYPQQLQDKQSVLQQLLADKKVAYFHQPVASHQWAFRNKAKMVVSGSVERPLLGIVDRQGQGTDLCNCPLYPVGFAAIFAQLKVFIVRAGLTPYHITRRRGELKYLLLTENSAGELMLRFVLRSEKKLPQLQQELSWLQQQIPQLKVISANIQPVPMAITEGEQEIMLTAQHELVEVLNQVPLWIRPQSFFQTNTMMAARLYRSAQQWTQHLNLHTIWDLFCGVGGFGLHCTRDSIALTGIEISEGAIECARKSAKLIGLQQVEFAALDSTSFATGSNKLPDLVIVNPPRRGIGAELCAFLARLAPQYLLYSSCNPYSMHDDLQYLEDYDIQQVQLFDLFPHTAHSEVLCLMQHQHHQH